MASSSPFRSPGFVTIGSMRIHYARMGRGRRALVALHGLMGGGAVWTPFARALGDDVDLILPDARGHGRSSVPPDGYLYPDHADDLCGLIAALGLVKPVLIGHSMGGMTAALAASRLGSALGGVILADPTFLEPAWQKEVHASDVFDQHRRFLSRDRDDLIADARERSTGRSQEMIAIATDARLRTDIRALDVLTPPNPDFRRLVSNILVPSLLILAERGVVSSETAQELVGLNPRLRVEMIQDAGHALPYDEPERLAALTRAFLQSHQDATDWS